MYSLVHASSDTTFEGKIWQPKLNALVHKLTNVFQYVVYNWNSFIADIGGYLGLLLGQSCLGMYHLIVTPSNWGILQKYFRRNNRG